MSEEKIPAPRVGDAVAITTTVDATYLVETLCEFYGNEDLLDVILAMVDQADDILFAPALIERLRVHIKEAIGDHPDYKVIDTITFLHATLDETDLALVRALL